MLQQAWLWIKCFACGSLYSLYIHGNAMQLSHSIQVIHYFLLFYTFSKNMDQIYQIKEMISVLKNSCPRNFRNNWDLGNCINCIEKSMKNIQERALVELQSELTLTSVISYGKPLHLKRFQGLPKEIRSPKIPVPPLYLTYCFHFWAN